MRALASAIFSDGTFSVLTNSLSLLAHEGRGTWRFTAKGDRTEVTWTYAFRSASCPSKPALSLFVADVYRPFMEQGMSAIKAHVERNDP